MSRAARIVARRCTAFEDACERAFLGMWAVMMVAMMLPSLTPMLRCYRRAVGGPHLGLLTLLVGAGYFLVWILAGLVVFPLGAALAAAATQQPMLARAAPMAAGVVVLIAGALQFSAWKTHRLACCGEAETAHVLPADGSTALQHGLRLGIRCIKCCANLMAILLAVGVMDLRAMILVTAAITLERLAPTRLRTY
ncbi:DUF2182 domain-containing protein [Aquabacter sp. CN5-332]|uniref:DUF2182 domain-containing protein n=1 Tax=Aquabacter sp. CN5-332 TaxID=3156608 RepID=UPI0032B5D2E6